MTYVIETPTILFYFKRDGTNYKLDRIVNLGDSRKLPYIDYDTVYDSYSIVGCMKAIGGTLRKLS